MTEPQTEPNRADWSPPKDYPYAPTQNPNPGKQRGWVHELTSQVQWLTQALADAVVQIDDLKLQVSKPPPKTVTTPKPKPSAKSVPKEE